jgi:hypothetical protein
MTFQGVAGFRRGTLTAAGAPVPRDTLAPAKAGGLGPTKRWVTGWAVGACLVLEQWREALRSDGRAPAQPMSLELRHLTGDGGTGRGGESPCSG